MTRVCIISIIAEFSLSVITRYITRSEEKQRELIPHSKNQKKYESSFQVYHRPRRKRIRDPSGGTEKDPLFNRRKKFHMTGQWNLRTLERLCRVITQAHSLLLLRTSVCIKDNFPTGKVILGEAWHFKWERTGLLLLGSYTLWPGNLFPSGCFTQWRTSHTHAVGREKYSTASFCVQSHSA